jgi:hypothetical protein
LFHRINDGFKLGEGSFETKFSGFIGIHVVKMRGVWVISTNLCVAKNSRWAGRGADA